VTPGARAPALLLALLLRPVLTLGASPPQDERAVLELAATERGDPDAVRAALDAFLFRAGRDADVVRAKRIADLARARGVKVRGPRSSFDAHPLQVGALPRSPARRSFRRLLRVPGLPPLSNPSRDGNKVAELYANGWGVKRDLQLAIALVCHASSVPAELESMVATLLTSADLWKAWITGERVGELRAYGRKVAP
jgi:hypothetical protein